MEFGVFNGQGLLSFAHFSAILEPNNLSPMMYGFDTFEGFSRDDLAAEETATGVHTASAQFSDTSFEQVKRFVGGDGYLGKQVVGNAVASLVLSANAKKLALFGGHPVGRSTWCCWMVGRTSNLTCYES